jgi:sigma-B regulation protein RsbU (phosphoserine phosphatase)
LNEDEIALFVADVSGHDLSMPFVTGGLKALMASFLNEALSPEETMIQLNASLRRFLPPERFVSACYVRYVRSRMELTIINAGHPFPLYQPAGKGPEFLPLIGDVLGIFDTTQFQTVELKVNVGDRLFVCTDGLTEGFLGENGTKLQSAQGMKVFQKLVAGHSDKSIQQLADVIINSLRSETDGPLDDDVILLGVEF